MAAKDVCRRTACVYTAASGVPIQLNILCRTAFNTPAKVLYDYEGQTEDELSVKEGISVFISDKIDSDWARAVLDGKVGLVPLAYVEESQ